MASTVELVIKAIDNASGTIKKVAGETGGLSGATGKLNDAFKNATGISLGTATAWGIAGMAVNKLYGFIKDSVVETQAYNLAMVDMARKMGTTTEEASRLVQVGDDVRLSQEQISTAMNIAIRNGVDPSIKGLAALADQYTALNSGTERGQFLLQTFGRSGMEMGKLMELGGDGIRNASEAINENLIVTKDAAKASERYYAATDELNDAMTGLKYTLGNGVIPYLADFIEYAIHLGPAIEANTAASEKGGYWAAYYAAKVYLASTASGDLVEETGFLKNKIEDTTGATEDAIEPTEDIATATGELAAKAKAAALAVNQEYLALTKLGGVNLNLSGTAGTNIQEALYLANGGALLQGMEKGITGRYNQPGHGGMSTPDYIAQMQQLAVAQEQIMMGLGKTQEDAVKSLQEVWAKANEKLSDSDAIKMLNGPSMGMGTVNYEVYIDVYYRIHGGLPGGMSPTQPGLSGLGGWGFSIPTGGAVGIDDFTVPPGYPNDTYPLRVESGERVTVTPAYENANGRRGSGQGGHVFYGPINFTVTNEASMADIMNSLSQL